MHYLLAAVLLAFSMYSHATIVIYSDQSDFLSYTTSLALEDFNSQTNGATFHTTPLDVGSFTLSMTGTPEMNRNYIDFPPVEFSTFDIDGTTVVNAYTSGDDSLFLTFDSAINAFGVDLAAFNDGVHRTSIFVNGTELIPSATSGDQVRFFGLISETIFTTIEFRGLRNDGYALDNVLYGTGIAVPVPAAAWLFGSALAGLGWLRRKQTV
jgi:hypothetical protein